MMLAPISSVLAHLLALFVFGLGRDLLPCLILLLLGLVSSVFLVLCLRITALSLSFALAFALDNISKMSLESIERSRHGHKHHVTGRFGSPSSLSLYIVALAGGKGHEGFVGHSSELSIKPIIMVAADVLLEVVAGDNTVGIKGAMGQQL
jgi:hypothetical protein